MFNLGFPNKAIGILLTLILWLCMEYLNCSEAEKPEPTFPEWAVLDIAWNPDGSKIAFSWTPLVWDSAYNCYQSIYDSSGIWFINPNGTGLQFFLKGLFTSLDWHPDGTKILVPGYEINLTDTTITPIRTGAYPRYNYNGTKITYTIYAGDSMGLWIINRDGIGGKHLNKNWERGDWAPNNKELLCQRYPFSPTPLIIIDTNGTILREILLPRTEASWPFYAVPTFSKYGSEILFAYRTEEYLADWQICITNADGTGLKQITNDGGVLPVWSPNNSRIAYCKYSFWGSEEEGDGQLWVMDADGCNRKQLTFVKK